MQMQQNYLGRSNWDDLLGMYSGLLESQANNNGVVQQELANNNGVFQDFTSSGLMYAAPGGYNPRNIAVIHNRESYNFDGGSVRQSIGDNNPVWYKNSLPELPSVYNNGLYQPSSSNGATFYAHSSNGPTSDVPPSNGAYYEPSLSGVFVAPSSITNPGKSCYISYKQPYISSSLPMLEGNGSGYDSASYILPRQNNIISSNPGTNYNLLQDGFPVPYRPIYNLNSPPKSEGGVASSAAGCLRFAPVTPDQGKQLKNQQLYGIPLPDFLIDEGPSQEKDKQENLLVSNQHQNVERHIDELQNLVDLSTTDITSSLKENQETLDGVHGGIDLNETPKQKPLRRRKHRPKVVREGKPKKTPTPKTPKNNSTENSTGKRKYVRKKGINASATPQGNATDGIKISDGVSGTKSCRRVLNFDLENPAEHETRDRVEVKQAEENEQNKELFNLNLDFQDPECSANINRVNPTSELHKEKQQGYTSEIHHQGTMVTFIPSTNIMPAGALSSLIPATATANNRTLNVIARNLSMRSANLYPNGKQNVYNQSHQDILGEGVDHSVIKRNSSRANIDRTRQLLQQSPRVAQDATGVQEQRGCKRPYYQTSVLPHAKYNTSTGSRLLGIYTEDGHYVDSSSLGVNASETSKKTNFLDISDQPTNILSSFIPATNSFSRPMETRMVNRVYTSSSTLHIKGNTPDYSPKRESSSKNLIRSAYQEPGNQHMSPVAVRQNFLDRHASSQVILRKEQPAKGTFHPNSHVHSHNSLAIVNWNMQSPINIASRSTPEHEIATSYSNVSTKKQRRRPATSKLQFSRNGLLSDYQNCSTTATDTLGQKELFMIDNVIDKLSSLQISDNGKEVKENGQTALIPYKADSSIVPYSGVDSIKRRRPRPKVDLDPESNRLWNLLMGKESTENVDKHTEKWWEEERNVFRGRIDSFIARMHLVQGDRRFSPWKGSVVDSVIGVFLTQNVSDHLSSSAFMSLAAKFPLPPSKEACWWNGAHPIVEEPEVQIIDPDGTITYQTRITRQPVFYQSSTTSSETSEQRPEDPIPLTRASSEKKNKRIEDEVISSQTSPDSIIYQAIEEARYGSGSNSETEGRVILPNHKNQTPEILSLQGERTAGFQEYGNHVIQSLLVEKTSEVRPQQPQYLAHYGQNLPLDRGSNTYAYLNKNMPNLQKCLPSSNQWSNLVQASIKIQPALPNKDPEPISYPQSITNGGCNQRFIKNNQEKSSMTTQFVKTFSAELMRPAEALPKSQTGETSASNKPSSGTGAGISNVRKRKLEREQTKAFDWDSLRKEVHSKGGRKERSKDAMDSLDYEALRHADVKKISDTIKERGMNNMLAERIKDFLNRLVEEHERIDLEWLREVSPDKAKDYLLSIRGLGLKSVECVRLLTLRNVAFPVDTNVGRIAVRLGWVPLQPLPESLQLHLLELYPVLESIQKYLWPRLCKLDQRTLYELHYQMITFGKVFCTKSKPNCNACPMRGECRHFASAFASARLALPGPEERSIVNSTAPVAVQEIPAETFFKPMALLPPADTNPVRETGFNTYSSEPIVDEPATPELSIEVTESDIEDAFYNDPDEIPTIKLNIEEFTTNLQSFMQEHTEMQEGDLSRAIVALNPTVASIPTQKLKNVNRLRTEHQVYELPDSHPLLKGLDRREPDDPSPYLLAIWTPGETADSIQLPESKCDYQGLGRLCNENTCFSCNSIREANSQTVRGTILIPCRTAMRGSFPLNGTYFQVNEVFADHESSLDPIDVPRAYIWNLPRRTVYFGTSVTSIFKGLTTEGIQFCFWRGFVCVRGFDQKTRAPRPLIARLHFPASKMVKTKNEENKKKATLPKE